MESITSTCARAATASCRIASTRVSAASRSAVASSPRRCARDATWLLRFYALSPQSEYYYQQLSARNLQPRVHINKIVALADIHGPEKVALALQDAIECQAFSSQYIENILHQRARLCPPSGPLHLTHRTDLLDLDLNPVDLTPYDLP